MQLLATVVLAFLGLAVLAVPVWVFFDARAHGLERPWQWAVVSVLPFGIVYYLLVPRRGAERRTPLLSGENWGEQLAIATLVAVIAAFLVAPPDPLTQLLYAAVLIPVFGIAIRLLGRLRRDGPIGG